jgi:6-pyruvoyltetrahydropterin/6-carboxytetrahydropterin synthase
MTTLTRRYHFSASHRLHSSLLSDAENAQLYGKCNNPFGHGHDYILEVTLTGPIHHETGLIVPLHQLDRFVRDVILNRFAHRNINLDLPEFQTLVPTTENMAIVITALFQNSWHLMSDSAAAGCRLLRIHLQETDRNGFELMLGTPEENSELACQPESVIANV